MELPTFFTLIIWHLENVECPISLCEFQMKCRQAQAIKKEITYFMRHCALKRLKENAIYWSRTTFNCFSFLFTLDLLFSICRRSEYANWCRGKLPILLLFFFGNLTSNQLDKDADVNGEYLWHFARIPQTNENDQSGKKIRVKKSCMEKYVAIYLLCTANSRKMRK